MFESRNRENVTTGKVARDSVHRDPETMPVGVDARCLRVSDIECDTELYEMCSSVCEIGGHVLFDGLGYPEQVGVESDR